MSKTSQQPTDETSPEQASYPETNRKKGCPRPPQTEAYRELEVVARGPVAIERELALADPQSFVVEDTTTATVRTTISEYQELDPFLRNKGKTDTNMVVWQLAAYPSSDHVRPVETDEWDVEFRAPVATWQTVARDIAANAYMHSVTPERSVKALRRFVRSGLTDDHAVFALLDLVDDHDVDVDWDRNRMLERLVDDSE
jgi:hypothetical protein